MNLRDWIIKQEITMSEAADQMGISRPTLSRILNKRIRASYRIAKKIENFTGGKFKIDDIVKGDVLGKGIFGKFQI